MSRDSAMRFSESLLSTSKFLTEHCDVAYLDGFRDNDDPLPLCMLGYFGQIRAEHFDSVPLQEWRFILASLERELKSGDEYMEAAVATGFIEGLIYQSEEISLDLWRRIEADLGPEARGYADAYRNLMAKHVQR